MHVVRVRRKASATSHVRGAAGFVATAVAAVGICWWALRGVDRSALADVLRTADLALVAPAVAQYTLAFYLLDTAGLAMVYRRHLVPTVPVRDIVVISCGKQLLGVLFSPLTKIVAPLYFQRRWRVPVMSTLGASEVLTVADLIVLVSIIAVSAVAGGLPDGTAPLGFGIAAALVLLLAWVWLSAGRGVLPRLRNSRFFAVFVRTKPVEMAVQVAMRFGVVAAMMLSWWLLMAAFGLHLDLGRLVQFCSVFLLVTQLPVSVGGYGGPQGVCVLLLADSWQLVSRADAAALSLVWSTGYLISRAVISTPFAVRLVQLLRAGRGPGEAS
jgi:hypothetical protein